MRRAPDQRALAAGLATAPSVSAPLDRSIAASVRVLAGAVFQPTPFVPGISRCGETRRLRRFWFPGVWPDGCLLDDSCYEVPGGAEPYDNGVTSSGPPPAVIVLRPPCRLQPEKYVVPSESGGERSVKVIRCLPAAGFPVGGSGNTSVRN